MARCYPAPPPLNRPGRHVTRTRIDFTGTYGRLVDAYRAILAELDPAERAAVFRGTAEHVYELAPFSAST